MMRKMKQILSIALMAVVMAGSVNIQAYAAIKVSTISLTIESDIEVGAEYSIDDVTVLTKSDKYIIGDMEFTNDGYEWGPTDTPMVEVYVEAADGYYLSLSVKNIKLKGATYVKGKKANSKTVLLTLALPSLSESTGEITGASWKTDTVASWIPAYNADYEVKLSRDGKTAGVIQTTSSTEFDFSDKMTRAGSYKYKVRAVNKTKPENKSEWVEAGERYINEETALGFRKLYDNVNSDYTEPGQVIAAQLKEGWNLDGTGWWYRNRDGGYTTNNWQLIDRKWYFFNAAGYMLSNTTTPDGYHVDSSGVWIQ